MTVAQLMANVITAAKRLAKFDQAWNLSYLPICPLEKVPSDIEVASAQTPKNVDILAKEIGLLPSEVDLYGKKKAKVALSTLDRLTDRKDGKYIIVAGNVYKTYSNISFLIL